MKLKNYTKLTAIGFAGISIFALSLPMWEKTDEFGLYFALGIGLLFAFFSYLKFKEVKEIREEEQAFAPPSDATVAEKIKYFKNMMYLSFVSFPFLSIVIAWDLNKLESGSVERVSIWAPVAFVYEQLGYWPGVLFVPLLGILVIFLSIKKIRQMKSEEKA
ncbi:hypothetical protein [Leptospira koniambonensis]|uniref:hypothetical protein n=1 Tax=Leptospira koniambonensis TaxID=2484950 RepID=UPI003EBE65AD